MRSLHQAGAGSKKTINKVRLMASVPISKTDLRNIISKLGNFISLGRKVTAPTDTSQRNKIRMATVLKRKLEKKLSLSE